ncbi:molybdenum cofactor guanylyltransferase [Clostridium sp.]|uniref:molybdenum cofactor guanylyltransferase n=1 Tax=Clostridium sp. TaxID=1506 RepID=UPI0026DCC246|nr:molybdenum cofactor guanylyltransferase [Clostridium sp.]MDO5038849.1 molybdenum cofactor guanylyltransferase [Clostridium sp.]
MINKSVIILSGGKNSRMNYKTKAFLKIDGIRFIDKIFLETSDFEEKILSCNDINLYEEFKNQALLVKDEFKDIGPMGGIYSCLKKSNFESSLVVASDMPFLNKDFLNYISSYKFNEDALIPVVNGKINPLCGIYKKSILKIIESMIFKKDYKLKNLLEKISTKYIECNEINNFINVNTEVEYNELCKRKFK